MFRKSLTQSLSLFTSSRSRHLALHTSALLNAQVSRQSIARSVKKVNNINKADRRNTAEKNRPSVVLGTRPGDEAKWESCHLAKVLVDMEELVSSTELVATKQAVGTVHLPRQANFGIQEGDKELLFNDLPLLSSDIPAKTHVVQIQPEKEAYRMRPTMEVLREGATSRVENTVKELTKANAFAKVIDLRNANAGGIAYENRRRIVEAFSTPGNPFDTGRPEVQAALLTYKIRNLWNHLTTYKKDLGNRRSLRKLVHQRAKILKYLKGVDQNRYENVLHQLALEPESVEGELVV